MDNGGVMSAYEVREMRKFREETEQWRRQVDIDRAELKHLIADMGTLTTAFNSMRRMLLTFALTIAGSAVIFALSVLAATNRLP